MTPAASPLPALAARGQLGDRAALEALLRALLPGLRHHLQLLLHERSDAEDALQETLWRVTRRLDTLRDTSLVRAWAYRIATREAMHQLRRARRHTADDLAEADSVAVVEAASDPVAAGVDENLLAYLDRLPAKSAVVVRLRFVDDLSQQEIAEALEIPLGTVKSRLAYGLSRLRALVPSATGDGGTR